MAGGSQELAPRRARFIEEYLKDFNAKQAAIRAGYSKNSAAVEGSRLLTFADVQVALAKRQDELRIDLQRYGITPEKVLRELALLGYSSMGSYYKVTTDGDPYIDLSNLSDEEKVALSELTIEEYTEGRGDNARDVKKTKIKLHEKKGPLELIGRHLGLFGANDSGSEGPLAKVATETLLALKANLEAQQAKELARARRRKGSIDVHPN